MKRRLLVALSLLLFVLVLPLVALGDVGVGAGGGTPGTSLNFQLVGHNDLSGHELDGNTVPRGMNSQVVIYDHYVYIGNRTDGSDTCGIGDPRRGVEPCPHPHPGILIADIADPSNPTVVGEIGPPYAGQVGITTRELRVWPQKKLLMVMTFRCSSVIHACLPGNDTTFPFDIKFFDLTDPVHPTFISNYDFDLSLHSMTPSADGTRTYLAYLRGGFGVLDTSKVANDQIPTGTVESLNDDL